jgi:polysaccharide deactylase WbmS-like protein
LREFDRKGTIASINFDDEASWRDVLFLTFDIDWAHDKVVEDTLSLVANAGVPATWFITHDTPLLSEMRLQEEWELGLHPNFNKLLAGDPGNGANAPEVVKRIIEIVPEARSVRSHSLTQNGNVLDLFKSLGLTHDVNHFVPSGTGLVMKPWLMWNGLTRVPYIWEDDYYCVAEGSSQPEMRPTDLAQSAIGLKVFDFHPIHVFLNTESLDRYERTRPLHNDPSELIKHRFEGYGTRNRLIDLLALAKQL